MLAAVSKVSPLLLPILLWAGSARAIAPANDSCAGAISIPSAPFTDAAITSDATSDPSDPTPECGKGSRANSVWYRFTSPGPGTLTVNTFDSDYDTILSVYDGSCEDLSAVPSGCNDDDPRDGAQSQVSIQTEGETTYFLMVSAFDGDGGNLMLRSRFQLALVCVGDCNADGALMQSECDVCRSIAEGQPLDVCPSCDGNGDGAVATTEVNQCRLGIMGCIKCGGDCDDSGSVTASDLVTAASIIAHCPCGDGTGGSAAGCAELPLGVPACRPADRDLDGCITQGELESLISNIYRCAAR